MSVPYEKRQKKWIEKHNVKVGDFVTVMQKYDSKTCGIWSDMYYWDEDMDKFVGRVCRVVKICEDAIELSLEGGCVSYCFPYSVLRKEKEMKKSYIERQAEWVKKHKVKIEDYVRLIRAASNREDGWLNVWPSTANKWVGKTLEVREISESNIACYNPEEEDWFAFPYFVLEKVKHEEKEMKKSYEERQDEWIKKNDLNIGDKVRIIRKAKCGEGGWLAVLAAGMDAVVGKAGVVKSFLGNAGIRVEFDKKFSWSLPYFVLEKVVEHKDKEWKVFYGLKVKTGDPVLVRDDEDENWRYALFSDVITGDRGGYWYRTCGLSYKRCIPYVGNEHLVGTKNDYKAPEEQTKDKFVFGAKVKATLSCGEEKEGVLIGFDEEDDDTPFEVAVQDEDADLGRIRYCAKSVTYID